jgi:DNA-binding transcriptional ArsR family regulator
MNPDQVIRALGALAQEHRLAVFRRLVQAGPDGLAAGKLAEAEDVAPSAMSFHFAQLTNAGLISQRRVGRSIIYSANYAAMGRLLAYLTENCCVGTRCGNGDAALDENAGERGAL